MSSREDANNYVNVEIVGIRNKVVSAERAKELSYYVGAHGIIAKWVEIDNFEVLIPLIILESGATLYGSEVWWTRR